MFLVTTYLMKRWLNFYQELIMKFLLFLSLLEKSMILSFLYILFFIFYFIEDKYFCIVRNFEKCYILFSFYISFSFIYRFVLKYLNPVFIIFVLPRNPQLCLIQPMRTLETSWVVRFQLSKLVVRPFKKEVVRI